MIPTLNVEEDFYLILDEKNEEKMQKEKYCLTPDNIVVQKVGLRYHYSILAPVSLPNFVKTNGRVKNVLHA